MLSDAQRVVLGIVNANTFVAGNGKDCSYIDLGFEKFVEDYNGNKITTYEPINKKEFYCSSNKVFLTSNAKDIVKKFEGQLVQMVTGESPNSEQQCKYTVLHTNIQTISPEDFVEIAKVDEIPNPNSPCFYNEYKISTRYVLLETKFYTIDVEKLEKECSIYLSINESDREQLKKMSFSSKDEAIRELKAYISDNFKSFVNSKAQEKVYKENVTPSDCYTAIMEELNNVISEEYNVKYSDRPLLQNNEIESLVETGLNTLVGKTDKISEIIRKNMFDHMCSEYSKNSQRRTATYYSNFRNSLVNIENYIKQKEDINALVSKYSNNFCEWIDGISEFKEVSTQFKSVNVQNGNFVIKDIRHNMDVKDNVHYLIIEIAHSSDEKFVGKVFLSLGSQDEAVTSFSENFLNELAKRSGRSLALGNIYELKNLSFYSDLMFMKDEIVFFDPSTITFKDISPNSEAIFDNSTASEDEKAKDPSASISTEIFIIPDHVLIGPFLINRQEQCTDGYKYTISVPDKGVFMVKDRHFATTRRFDYDTVKDIIKEVRISNNDRKYAVNLKSLQNNIEKYDFIDNKKLTEYYCLPILSKSAVFQQLKSSQMDGLRKNHEVAKLFQNVKEAERYHRAFKYLSIASDLPDLREKFFKSLDEVSSTRQFIRNYIDDNADKFLQQYRKTNVDTLKAETKSLNEQLADLRNKIEQAKKQLASYTDLSPEQLSKQNVTVAKKGISSEEHEVSKAEHKELLREIEKKSKEIKELTKTKEHLTKEIATDISDLSSKYLDMHSMLKAFTSTPTVQIGNSFTFTSPEVSRNPIDNLSKGRNRYIEDLYSSLLHKGRNIDKKKLIAMVITIAQNQFTVLAGLPGSGKTSFVKTMGKALNLQDRLLSIPVARGWTSQRDILGYWNSLAGNFQAAPTGLWELLNTLDKEKDDKVVAPALLLLDEMNLSSPEHYFSSFMGLADSETDRKVFTGSPERPFLNIPNYLRFIGTVNSDDTVNAMSPRMLDRSAVILFDEKPSMENDLKKGKGNGDTVQTLSAHNWLELFDVKEKNVPKSAYDILTKIEETLYDDNNDYGQRVVISYRKHEQIIKFLTVSITMYETIEIALDYAVKQFVLPMINGFGEGFGNRLSKLYEILEENKLEDSARILNRIIAEGSDRMNSYQFLA